MPCRPDVLLTSTMIFFSIAVAEARTGTDSPAVKPAFSLEFQAINEMSGIVRSDRFEDVYWIHNDSGDMPRLFAINRDGQVIVPEFLKDTYHGNVEEANKRPWTGIIMEGAEIDDWESIEIRNDTLYIADTGNNGYDRRNLGIYMLGEPNPYGARESQSVEFAPIHYPEQYENAFVGFLLRDTSRDSEAMFMSDGKLYFLTKSRKPHEVDGKRLGTTLLHLDTLRTDESNELEPLDENPKVHLPTGADLSPDGEHLAVLTYSDIWVFRRPPRGDRWLSEGRAHKLPLPSEQTGHPEGIAWKDNDTLLFGNEPGHFFTVELKNIPEYD